MPELLFSFADRQHINRHPELWQHVLDDFYDAVSREYYLCRGSVALPRGTASIKLAKAALGSTRILQYRSRGDTRTTRTAKHIQQDSSRLFLIWFVISGSLQITQSGRTSHARPGQFVISESHTPLCVVNRAEDSDYHESYQVIVPQHVMAEVFPNVRRYCNMPFDIRKGASKVAYEIFSSLFDNADGLPRDNAEQLANQALKSIALSIGENNPLDKDSILRSDINEYIHAHIAEPHLNAVRVAQACKISLRSLYRVFCNGETFHQYVLKARLRRAKELLERAADSDILVSEIAHMTGFPNAAHFSRAFKGEFGHAPREMRRGARLQCLSGLDRPH